MLPIQRILVPCPCVCDASSHQLSSTRMLCVHNQINAQPTTSCRLRTKVRMTQLITIWAAGSFHEVIVHWVPEQHALLGLEVHLCIVRHRVDHALECVGDLHAATLEPAVLSWQPRTESSSA